MDKPTIILAIAIFMASAPNPDAEAIAEMTANFIVAKNTHALQASDQPVQASPELIRKPEATAQPMDNEAYAG